MDLSELTPETQRYGGDESMAIHNFTTLEVIERIEKTGKTVTAQK